MATSAPTRTRVIGYIRVSSREQAEDGISLAAQRAKIEAYAVAMDLELVGIQEDAGISAKSMDGRAGLARALAMLETGQAEGILIAKLDRLTRSVRDLGDLVDRYFANRWSLLSVSDSIDTQTAAGRLVLNVLTSVAQWEREATGERTRDALAHLKSEGVLVGGVPLGVGRTGEFDADGGSPLRTRSRPPPYDASWSSEKGAHRSVKLRRRFRRKITGPSVAGGGRRRRCAECWGGRRRSSTDRGRPGLRNQPCP